VEHQDPHGRQGYGAAVPIALLTNYLAPYRVPLYERLANSHDLEVLCYGGGERYVPSWFADLDRQLADAPFPARRIGGPLEALTTGRRYDTVIAPFAGGAVLPAAYFGAKRFVLWASVWAEPRSPGHALARPVVDRIYRRADAVVAYGEHVKRFVVERRGHGEDVFVAPQAVEPELFARSVSDEEIQGFRDAEQLGDGPLVLYVGRLVPEKGVDVLLEAWNRVRTDATLVLIGEGSVAPAATNNVRALGARPRSALATAYAAAEFTVLPSVPTPRFKEPWGLVCNESMHQGRPVIATTAVGAAAGGLVRDGETGVVVAPGDEDELARAIGGLLADEERRARLGAAAREAVAPYTYGAMLAAFDLALAAALR
jgi:glycosyltransferase involved in cell wall biosynthesis